MKKYRPIYAPVFQKRVRQYSGFKKQIRMHVVDILQNPYLGTEVLQRGLKGLRSIRITRNFRIVFAISKEIKTIPYACDAFPQFCIYPDDTVVLITVGPHSKVYKLK